MCDEQVSSRYFKALDGGLKVLVVSRLLGCMKHPHLAVAHSILLGWTPLTAPV